MITPTLYNVYCDESCHLQNDGKPVMVLGALWLPAENVREVADRILEIKQEHGLNRHAEVKWTKASPNKAQLYIDLVDFFFDRSDLRFRALIAPKDQLHHEDFGQTHDQWYYKMYFDMLKVLLSPRDNYQIYLDIKDTRGGKKVRKLHDVLCSNAYDFSHQIIQRVQVIRSHEAPVMQLADVLIGIISFANRDDGTSQFKRRLVDKVKKKTGYTLQKTTLYREEKVNLFRWIPRGGEV